MMILKVFNIRCHKMELIAGLAEDSGENSKGIFRKATPLERRATENNQWEEYEAEEQSTCLDESINARNQECKKHTL